MDRNPSLTRILLVGFTAGAMSGLLGVGGGIVMVPLLVLLVGFSQHAAHATSLAAVVPIAGVGALTYAVAGEIHLGYAALLAAGSLVGAPVGASLMAKMTEARLKTVYGLLLVAMGVFLVIV
jgi:uncharacterized membrane protein YfcA